MTVVKLKTPKPKPSFDDLETQVHDLVRASIIAYEMTMQDNESDDPEREGLGLFAVEQVERLAKEFRESFYACMEVEQ